MIITYSYSVKVNQKSLQGLVTEILKVKKHVDPNIMKKVFGLKTAIQPLVRIKLLNTPKY